MEMTMVKKRVLVLCRRSLLAQGIEKALRRVGKGPVASLDLDQPRALEQIPLLHPEVIITDIQDLSQPTVGTFVFGLLRDNPEAKVVCLNSKESDIEIYSREHLPVSGVGALLTVIETRIGTLSQETRAEEEGTLWWQGEGAPSIGSETVSLVKGGLRT